MLFGFGYAKSAQASIKFRVERVVFQMSKVATNVNLLTKNFCTSSSPSCWVSCTTSRPRGPIRRYLTRNPLRPASHQKPWKSCTCHTRITCSPAAQDSELLPREQSAGAVTVMFKITRQCPGQGRDVYKGQAKAGQGTYTGDTETG